LVSGNLGAKFLVAAVNAIDVDFGFLIEAEKNLLLREL
jgi:hypothetical protein